MIGRRVGGGLEEHWRTGAGSEKGWRRIGRRCVDRLCMFASVVHLRFRFQCHSAAEADDTLVVVSLKACLCRSIE